MKIGVPREIKNGESRVGLTPDATSILVSDGHVVLIERGAGAASGYGDEEYRRAGAHVADAETVFGSADLVVKVKEPQATEVACLGSSQMLFTYLHLAGNAALARQLLDRGVTAVGYETVATPDGRLPLLAPMSAIAGRLAAQIAARLLEAPGGGRGKLMGGIPGVAPSHVTIVGAGVAGTNAADAAAGLGARVRVLDVRVEPLERADGRLHGRVETLVSGPQVFERCLAETDVLICAALVPGARAPVVVERPHLGRMPAGAALIDLAIDQGGSAETSRPTTHDEPTYIESGVVHYCVPNVPALVPRTATLALVNATLPYIRVMAAKGLSALLEGGPLAGGLNLFKGRVMNPGVAAALGIPAEAPV
jgi:alanine dehydrogenase